MRLSHCIRAGAARLWRAAGLRPRGAATGAVSAQHSATSSFTCSSRARRRSATSRSRSSGRRTAGRLPAAAASARRSTSSLGSLRVRYDADWKPLELTLDATVARAGFRPFTRRVSGDTATQRDHAAWRRSRSSNRRRSTPSAVLLPNPFFAPFEALAARLETAAPGYDASPSIEPAQSSFDVRSASRSTEQHSRPSSA